MKLRQIQNHYNPATGEVPYGTYFVEGELKLAELKMVCNDVDKEYMTNLLSSRYVMGDTIYIKRNRHIVVYYEKLDKGQNKYLIKHYLRLLTPNQQASFLSRHAYNLFVVFGDDFKKYFMDFIFDIGRIPERFEIYCNGAIIDNPQKHKERWKTNPSEFRLISYVPKVPI